MTVAAKELSQAAANMEVDDKSNLSPGKESLSVLSSSPATTDNTEHLLQCVIESVKLE